MALSEFELISRYFSPLLPSGVGGDDCAVLPLPPGQELAVSTDTLVAGVHFPADCDPEALGWRAVGCCGSDLAAMGAVPLGFTLALTIPAVGKGWLADFSRGLAAAAAAAAMPLLGGDTTRGPLSLTLTVLGAVPSQRALRRRGGRAGDQIWVSGPLGGAAAALLFLDQPGSSGQPGQPDHQSARPEQADQLLDRYWKPRPRLQLGQALLGIAHAAIDISDGLVADLGHLCTASGCGAALDPERLPLHPQAVELLGESSARALAMTGGDDYELCFTASAAQAGAIAALGEAQGLALHCIGELVAEPGLHSMDGGALALPASHGYQHFGGPVC